jgi:hypothetical protein
MTKPALRDTTDASPRDLAAASPRHVPLATSLTFSR